MSTHVTTLPLSEPMRPRHGRRYRHRRPEPTKGHRRPTHAAYRQEQPTMTGYWIPALTTGDTVDTGAHTGVVVADHGAQVVVIEDGARVVVERDDIVQVDRPNPAGIGQGVPQWRGEVAR